MMIKVLQIVVVALLFVVSAVVASHGSPPGWWQFGEYLDEQKKIYGVLPSITCDTFALTAKQSEMCKNPRYRELMIKMGLSVNVAALVSNYTFQNRRWNGYYTGGENVFGKIMTLPIKESAVVYSLVSAMAMYTVARECARGELSALCSCAKHPPHLDKEGWADIAPQHSSRDKQVEMHWGGCTEDTGAGYRLTKPFIDSSWLPSWPPYARMAPSPALEPWPTAWPSPDQPLSDDDRTEVAEHLANLHVSEQGRQLIKKSEEVQCRCHGMSGSCALQTCWKEMKHWKEVGADVKDAYDSAVKVKLNHKATRPKLVNSDATVKKHTEDDLVYLHDSPSFCDSNDKLGIPGTSGRECNISSVAENSCSVLCCSRGHKTVEQNELIVCGKTLIRHPPPIRFVYKRCEVTTTKYFCK